MRGAGVCCNQNSFATVISSCGTLDDDFLGRQVLAHVMDSGFGSNVSVAIALIHTFGNCGDVKNADCVFHRMPERDTICILSEWAFSVDNLRWGMESMGFDFMALDDGAPSVQNGHHRNALELPIELCRTSK
ncbi:hypothetical protein C5167_048363 [Papaver somniferum]|uniref:Pentatricopeptide repeat-containing protein n=1 Tax=Papaver somniferum TaxID=3469 RepID=A0A4Y7KLY6_PAPSO|nr:hypothetical protein C5167_048363 [Papaver somniferum]